MEKYTVTVDEEKTVCWFKHETDRLHRVGKPAVERATGTREWFIDGKRHRLDGPAIEWSDGSKEWWVNGQLHRTDGPAIEDSNGAKLWWIDGMFLTREEFEKRMRASCDGKVVEIDGKKYRLTAQ